MVRNPNAYGSEEFVEKVLEEEIVEVGKEKWRLAVNSLFEQLRKVRPTVDYRALVDHCRHWAERGYAPQDTPAAKALPHLRCGRSVSHISKVLSPDFSLSPSGLRRQLTPVFRPTAPVKEPPPVRPLVDDIRQMASAGTFSEGGLEVVVTPTGLRISGREVDDSVGRALRDFLVRLYGRG